MNEGVKYNACLNPVDKYLQLMDEKRTNKRIIQ